VIVTATHFVSPEWRRTFTKKLSSLVIYDGVRVHLMLNYAHGLHNFSFALMFANKPGFTLEVAGCSKHSRYITPAATYRDFEYENDQSKWKRIRSKSEKHIFTTDIHECDG
jgi:hypothetical protein